MFHKGEHKQRFTCEVHTACVKNGYTLEAVMIPVNVLDRRRMRRGDSSPALTAPSSRMGHGPGRTDTAKLNSEKCRTKPRKSNEFPRLWSKCPLSMLQLLGLHPEPNRSPAQRVRLGEESQQNKCALTFEKSRSKRTKSILRPPRVPPIPFRHESSEASRGGKRRNSLQSAVFGEAGNGTVVGISELVRPEEFEPPAFRSAACLWNGSGPIHPCLMLFARKPDAL